MREFFKPRRRRIGVVALVLALLCVASWMRSFVRHEGFAFSVFGRKHTINTRSGNILWLSHNPLGNPGPYAWSDAIAPDIDLDFGTLPASYQPIHRIIPHWAIMIPLALIAAWLLLAKQPLVKRPVELPKDQP